MGLDVKAVKAIIENIDKKIPLGDFGAKLRELNLPSSNAWAKTKELLADLLDGKLSPTQEASFNNLCSWVEDFVLHSPKAIYIFKLSKNFHCTVDDAEKHFVKNLTKLARSDYPHQFPAMLAKDELAVFSNAFCLRKVESGSVDDKVVVGSGDGGNRTITVKNDKVDVVFSYVKEYQVRDEIHMTPSEVKAVDRLSGYYKIIGVKTALHEHVDVVRFNKGADSIELHLDISRPGNAPCTQLEIANRAKAYIDFVNACIAGKVTNFVLPSPLNLFGCIKKIYDSLEGSVCELGFSLTVSGSVKTEKMKRTTSDLRSEPWHAAGMGAVNKSDVDMYRLSVCWQIVGSNDQPILSIPGNYKSLSTAEVEYAIISGCKERKSFDFAFSRLANYAV